MVTLSAYILLLFFFLFPFIIFIQREENRIQFNVGLGARRKQTKPIVIQHRMSHPNERYYNCIGI
jgi:hypothetical protein